MQGQPKRFVSGHNRRRPFKSGIAYAIDPDTGCWNWIGDKDALGYGRLRERGSKRRLLAHRVSWESVNGRVPEGLELDHLCRNPPCVNPDHLEAVTHLVNMRRALAKITLEQAREVKRLRREESLTYPQIAAVMGIPLSTVSNVICGVAWKDA